MSIYFEIPVLFIMQSKYLNVFSGIYTIEYILLYYFSLELLSLFRFYLLFLCRSRWIPIQCRMQAISRFSFRFIFLIFRFKNVIHTHIHIFSLFYFLLFFYHFAYLLRLGNLACKRTSKNPTAGHPRIGISLIRQKCAYFLKENTIMVNEILPFYCLLQSTPRVQCVWFLNFARPSHRYQLIDLLLRMEGKPYISLVV